MTLLSRIFIALLALCIQLKLFSQDLFDYKNSFNYANYLYLSKNYSNAINEYERLLFLDKENDSVKFQLIKSIAYSGNINAAIARSDSFYKQYSFFPHNFALTYTKLLLNNKFYKKANDFLEKNKNISEIEKSDFKAISLLLQYKWKDAELEYKNSNSEKSVNYKALCNFIDEGQKTRYKNPLIATSLSVFIPGSGKIYTNNWKDGLISFLATSIFAFQSYRGFNKYGLKSERGWIFGGFALGFYAGNIYGSHKAAKSYNKRKNQKIEDKIKNTFIYNY